MIKPYDFAVGIYTKDIKTIEQILYCMSLKRCDLGRNNALTMYVSPAIIKKDVPE